LLFNPQENVMPTLLKRGSRGAAVRTLQKLLNEFGTSPRVLIDGDYGPATETAVRAAQGRLELVVDGIAGPQTMTALRRASEPVFAGRPEPDKAAMQEGVSGAPTDHVSAKAPPNVAALNLLGTARPVSEIIVHCAATPEGKDFTVDDIRAWHKQRGWTDIGYHYVVYRDGRVMLGRPVGQIGSHVAGHNTGTIGIAYVGGVTADGRTAKDTRTDRQGSSLLWLVRELVAKHTGVRKVTGHNQYAAKACPSFDVSLDQLGAIV
jgi:N-acetylmuramoyl-L-alanine amidase